MKATIQLYENAKNELGVTQTIADIARTLIRTAHELKIDSLVYQLRVETKGDKK